VANHISFVSTKGGQGKTTLATTCALANDGKYFTNDFLSGTKEIYESLFKDGMFNIIDNKILNINIEDEEVVVFDFGGFLDKKYFCTNQGI
jgi:hypothetical protein